MENIQTLEVPQSTTPSNDQTLLGNELASGKPDETTLLGAAKTELTPEQTAENKRLLEADQASLTPDEKTKREELLKAQELAQSNVVPEKYEVKLPEGMTLNTALVEKLTPVLREIGVSQANFQKLADVFAPQMQAQAQAQTESSIAYFKDIVQGWRRDSMTELGPNWQNELAIAAKAMDQSKVPGLREMASETGVGNHPAFVKFAIWAGKMIRQDNFSAGTPSSGELTEQEKLNIMYPTMKS